MATIETTVTYLEMTDPADLVPAASAGARARIDEVRGCTVAFYRFLYGTVGAAYHWVERTRWSDERLAEHLANPAVRIWALYWDGCPAGYFELHDGGAPGDVEVAYFGLMPGFLGLGLGKHLLTEAVRAAWATPGARRVWLHTCTLDAPQALPNYLARGFRPYKTDTETIETLERGA